MSYERLSNWEPYKSHYTQHKQIIDNSNNERLLLINELKEKGLVDYALRFESIEEKKASKLKAFFTKRKGLKNEFSYLGYNSFRSFVYTIGFPIFAFILSVTFLILILNPNTIENYKKLYFFAGLGFIYVSSFWVLRSFLTKTDFPKWSYDMSFIVSALITSSIVYISIGVLSKIEQKKKQTQKDLQDLVLNGNQLVNLIKTT
ncbi:conserved membrane protein of unknown function [Tenacibaculum sp. 190524A02b]|uniref:hypothetical protein n=1 Tax=Tenacibaculum vairaonense TaxID=3137860 RepID=UPI0032B2DF83